MKTKKTIYSPAINTPTIPFSQTNVIITLDKHRHKKLLEFDRKYGGLCDLICNRVLIDNTLGKETRPNSLVDRITVERLDEGKIKKSHILNVYSIFRKAMAYLFSIYPDNIFSILDQWKLVHRNRDKTHSVNRGLLLRGLENIANNESLKLEFFSKGFFSLTGHSLLVQKTSADSFIFFDPNSGEHRNLSFTQLCSHIDRQLLLWDGTDILFIKANNFLNRLNKR